MTEPRFPANHPSLVEAAARAAHEANRAYCLALGDTSQPTWDDAPDWQQGSVRLGVWAVLQGTDPAHSHELWLKHKRDEGWRYGPVKDVEKKEHPAMLPYAELPPEHQAKDAIFVAVVSAVASALGPYSFSFQTLRP